MKRCLAVFALVLALTVGLIPGLAFAAAGDDLAAGSTLMAQEDSFAWGRLSVVDGPKFAGPKCTVSFAAHYNLYQLGRENGLRLEVHKGSTLIKQAVKSVSYDEWNSNEDQVWSCGLTSTGTYTVTAYGIIDSSETKIGTRTFKVVKLANAVKTAVPTVNADCKTIGKVELSWDNKVFGKKVTGAKIFRAPKKSGKYALVKTTTKASYTDKVKKNTNYFYKVKLYVKSGKKTYVSKFSEIKCLYLTKPAVPAIKSVEKTDKGVKLTWKSSPNCGVYWILRATSKTAKPQPIDCAFKRDDGKFETTVSNAVTKGLTYIDTTVEPGKTYYYKIRTYRGVSASIISESDKVKIKA